MSDKLSTGEIKKILAQHTGADEKGWKRVTKYKNSDDEWVREFTHASMDDAYLVIERKDGTVDVDAKSEANQQTRKNNGPSYVSLVLKVNEGELDEDVLDRVKAERGQEIFKEFIFAIYSDPNDTTGLLGSAVYICDKKGLLSGQPVYLESLFPANLGVEDMNEGGTYAWLNMPPPLVLAKAMVALGMEWDETFQDGVQSSLTHLIKMTLRKGSQKPSPSPKP